METKPLSTPSSVAHPLAAAIRCTYPEDRESSGGMVRLAMVVGNAVLLVVLVVSAGRSAAPSPAGLKQAERDHALAAACLRRWEERPGVMLELLAAGNEEGFRRLVDLQAGLYRRERELQAELDRLHNRPAPA